SAIETIDPATQWKEVALRHHRAFQIGLLLNKVVEIVVQFQLAAGAPGADANGKMLILRKDPRVAPGDASKIEQESIAPFLHRLRRYLDFAFECRAIVPPAHQADRA